MTLASRDVITENQILVSQVEFAARDYRMGPDAALGFSDFGLGRNGKSSGLIPSLGRRFRQHDFTRSLCNAIKHSVRDGHRSFSQLVLLLPNHFARFEGLAKPAGTVGVAVEIITNQHHATVMVLHDLVFVHVRWCIARQRNQFAPDAVS